MSGYVEDFVRQVEDCVMDTPRPRCFLAKHKNTIFKSCSQSTCHKNGPLLGKELFRNDVMIPCVDVV